MVYRLSSIVFIFRTGITNRGSPIPMKMDRPKWRVEPSSYSVLRIA